VPGIVADAVLNGIMKVPVVAHEIGYESCVKKTLLF
jgi:hypothetical protein